LRRLCVIQVLPALDAGGVERGTLEIARALVAAGHRSIVVSRGGRLQERLVSEGSEHVTLDVGRKSPLTFLRCVRPLRELMLESRADILHLRSRMPAWVAWRAWRRLGADSRPHLVTTVHGTYSRGFYSSIMTRGERVIAISESIHAHIRKHWPKTPAERIRVIPRGVDPIEFPYGKKPSPAWLETFAQQFPATRGQDLLAFPARLTRWKGHEDFLAVIAALRQRGRAVHGLCIGDVHPRRQQFRAELDALAHKLGVHEHVSFLGHRTDVAECMAASRMVFSLPQDPEAFGRVPLEALTMGVPVIAYEHGGVAEQLAVILPAGLVPVGDVEVAATRAEDFLNAPPQVPASHPFTLERLQRSTLALYSELAGE